MRNRVLTKRKILVGTGLITLSLVLFFVSGIPQDWILNRARNQIQQQNWKSSWSSLKWAELFQSPEAEINFLNLRIARKLGRQEEFSAGIRKLQNQKYDIQRLERELWMFEAQTGNLTRLELQIGELFTEGEDLQEICEALVLGYLQTYRKDKANQILDLWQADFPNDAQPHFLRGRLLEHETSLEPAEEEYRAALKLNPRHDAAAYGLARVMISTQRHQQAIPFYELCANHGLSPQPGFVGVARCYRELDELDRAELYLKRAETVDDQELAIEAWKLVGETESNSRAKLWSEWGQLELARSNNQGAIQYLKKALDQNPYDWRLRYHLGQALIDEGESEEGTQQLELFNETRIALESCDPMMDRIGSNPEDVEARYQVGSVMLNYISPNQGLVWLNSALKYDPDHLPTHRLLADYFSTHIDDHPKYAELSQKHQTAVERLTPKAVEPAVP